MQRRLVHQEGQISKFPKIFISLYEFAKVGAFKELIRNFSPSWFAVIMGTGVFATSTYLISLHNALLPLYPLFQFLAPLNFVLFFVILIPWSLRWLLYTREAIDDFRDPIKGNFYVTFGIGILALSTNLYFMNLKNMAYLIWIAGMISVIIIQISLMFTTFVGMRVKLEHINPVWFLGTTGLLLIPGSGIVVISLGNLNTYHLLIFDFAFGTGFFLYLALLSIWLYRFILHTPLKSSRIPLFWINLGPIGAALTSLVTYFHLYEGQAGVSLFFSLLFLGFGAWWFIMAILVTLYYLKTLRPSYRSVWWSFTFPLGQYLVGVMHLNSLLNYPSVYLFSILLYSVLFFLWFANGILTLGSLIGKGFQKLQEME